MDSRTQYNPRTVEEVFRDFKGRRAGLIKALTTGICCCNHSFFFSFSFPKKNWNFNYFVQRRFPSKKMCFECKILDFRFFFFSFYVMGQREFRVGLFSYTSLLFSLTKLLVLVFIIQECKWINTVFFSFFKR